MKVLNFGSLNIDNVYAVDHIVQPGETQTASSLNLFPGGKGLNQSLALAKAGIDVRHAGAVGHDGDVLLNVLKEGHVNCDLIRILDEPSGHAIIQLDKNAQNCIIIHGGANRQISEDMINETLSHFDEGDILLLQNEINNIDKIVNCAYAKKMIICLNPSPYDDSLKSIDFGKISIFLMNEVEGFQMTGKEDPDDIITEIKQKYPSAKVLLTLGGRGSVYYDGSSLTHQDAFKVKAVDTTAAGDTFTGYFLAGFIKGDSPKKILERASKAAAIAVSRKGAAVSIPTPDEVDAFKA